MIVSSRNKAIKKKTEKQNFSVAQSANSLWFQKVDEIMIFLRQYALLCECFLCEIANVWNNMTEQVMSIFVIYFKVEAIVSLLSCVWVMVFAFCNLHWPAIGFGTNCTQYTEPPGPK